MDFDTLVQRLDLSNPAAPQINALTGTFRVLMTHLAERDPEQAKFYQAMIDEMNQTLIASTIKDIGMVFGGHGPIACRLREHLALHDWARTELNKAESKNAFGVPFERRVVNKNLSDVLIHKLQMFDFKPTNEPTKLRELSHFLETMRPYVMGLCFRTPQPPLQAGVDFTRLKSGIYGDPSQKDFHIILRTCGDRDDDIQHLLISSHDGFQLLHWHPWEKGWFSSRMQWTFDNLTDQIQTELTRAVMQASPMEKNYDFEEEMLLLSAKAGEVFDEEKWLPPRLYYANHQTFSPVENVQRPTTGYERDHDDSLIMATVDDVSVIFRNTKGAYASRVCHYVRNYPVVPTSVQPDEIQPELKTALIQRVATVLAYCNMAISHRKSTVVNK